MGWDDMIRRAGREHGGFDPDIRHRTTNATISLALVARGLAVTLLPELVLPEDPAAARLAVRAVARQQVDREILAVTRAADAGRPSTRALLAAIRAVAARLPVSAAAGGP
jgi:DNA-binding transcriptional LysR family regulator